MTLRLIHCTIALLIPYTWHAHALFERSSAALSACREEWEQAHAQHLDLLARDYTDPQLLHDTGVCAYKMQDYEHAVHYFNQVATSEHANDRLKHDAHYNCGNAYAMQSAFKQAAHAYEQALLYDPDDQAAKDNLAVVKKLQEQGDDSGDSESDSGDSSGDQGQNGGNADNQSSDDSSSGDDQQEQQQDNAEQDNDQEKSSDTDPSEQEQQDSSEDNKPPQSASDADSEQQEQDASHNQEQSEQNNDTEQKPDQKPSESENSDAPHEGQSDRNNKDREQGMEDNASGTDEQDAKERSGDDAHGQESTPDQTQPEDAPGRPGDKTQGDEEPIDIDENGFFATNQDDEMPSWMTQLLEQQDQDDAAMNRAFTMQQMQSGDNRDQKHCW